MLGERRRPSPAPLGGRGDAAGGSSGSRRGAPGGRGRGTRENAQTRPPAPFCPRRRRPPQQPAAPCAGPPAPIFPHLPRRPARSLLRLLPATAGSLTRPAAQPGSGEAVPEAVQRNAALGRAGHLPDRPRLPGPARPRTARPRGGGGEGGQRRSSRAGLNSMSRQATATRGRALGLQLPGGGGAGR